MVLIFCTDKNGGLYFNNRRQSCDKLLYKRISDITSDKKLYTSSYSAELFKENDFSCIIEDDIRSLIDKDVYYFAENIDVNQFCNKCDKIIQYNWNREYPHDITFEKSDFKIVCESVFEFAGNSHEKITETVYKINNEE